MATPNTSLSRDLTSGQHSSSDSVRPTINWPFQMRSTPDPLVAMRRLSVSLRMNQGRFLPFNANSWVLTIACDLSFSIRAYCTRKTRNSLNPFLRMWGFHSASVCLREDGFKKTSPFHKGGYRGIFALRPSLTWSKPPNPLSEDRFLDGQNLLAELAVLGDFTVDLPSSVYHGGVVSPAQQPAHSGGRKLKLVDQQVHGNLPG